MAIERISHSTHSGHASTPAVKPAAPSPTIDRPVLRDSYKPTRPAISRPAQAAEQPEPAKPKGSQLAQLANLGRLQHVMHLVTPLANVAKGVRSGAASAVAHAHHGMHAMASTTGGFIARLGGPLSAIATGLSAVVAVFDIKRAAETWQDPQATSRQKAVTTLQAGLSGFSGAAGIAAALTAAGLALPFSIPALLTVSTVTGLGSFVVSLFNRRGHEGHTEAHPA